MNDVTKEKNDMTENENGIAEKKNGVAKKSSKKASDEVKNENNRCPSKIKKPRGAKNDYPEGSDEYYMSLALKQGELAAKKGEVPIGAVVVFGNEIISSARNEREEKGLATGHAELLAIEKACRVFRDWRLERCTLYVTLEPCPMCLGAAVNARIPRVVFGASDKAGGACGSCINMHEYNICNHRLSVTGGVLGTQCSEILKNYFRSLRKS